MEAANDDDEALASLTGPGVLMRTLRPGNEDTMPKKKDLCVIHYETRLEDGKLVDTSRQSDRSGGGRPLSFHVGAGEVIPGLDYAIQHVPLHAVVELAIPSLYGYPNGCPPRIPTNAELIYLTVEVLKIDSCRH